MKTLFFLLSGFVFAVFASANPMEKNPETNNNSGISFYEGTWEQALEQAKKEGKPIFLDISASWCSVCKKLKTKTFSDGEVAKYFNANFINVNVDGEKGEGIRLAEKYGVKKYPGLLLIDSGEKVIAQTAGYKNPSQLIDFGKKTTE
jgi:thiol:disulfide interchange protein